MAELALPCSANGCFMPCRRAGKALILAQKEFFHLLPTRLGKSATFPDSCEPAFFQDAQRADVVFSGTGVQGTYLAVFEKG